MDVKDLGVLGVKDVKRLMDAMAAAGVTDLEIEWDGHEELPGGRVSLKRQRAKVVAGVATQPEQGIASALAEHPARQAASETQVTAAVGPAVPHVTATAAPSSRGGVDVTAPIVGTFYASPSPDQPAFVKAGDRVAVGQVLCIIEAMKLMNEIESEVAGTVIEVLVQNEDPVEYGQTLFRIDPA